MAETKKKVEEKVEPKGATEPNIIAHLPPEPGSVINGNAIVG